MVLSEFYIQGHYIDGSFFGDYEKVYPLHDFLTKCGYISGMIGFTLFFFMFEIIEKYTKYFLTIINIIFVVIIIVSPIHLMTNIIYVILVVNALISYILILMITIRFRDKYQGMLITLLLAYTLILAGHTIDSTYVKTFYVIPLALAPVLYILGALITLIPIFFKSQKSSRIAIFCMMLASISFLFVYTILFVDITYTRTELGKDPLYMMEHHWFIYMLIPWIFTLIVFLIFVIILLRRKREILKDLIMQREFYDTFIYFILSLSLSRIFFSMHDLWLILRGDPIFLFVFACFAWISLYLAMAFFVRYFDKYFLHSYKQILTKLIFGYALLIIFPILFSPFLYYSINLEILLFFIFIGIYLFGFVVLLIFLIILVAIKIKGYYRFLLLCTGLIILIFANLIDQLFIISDSINLYKQPSYLIIHPCLAIIGAILFSVNIDYGFKVFLEFYTAKKICLVHRGRIEGATHMCPQCFVTYCKNCYDSVIAVENRCWSCDYVFIKGKPTPEIVIDVSKEFTSIDREGEFPSDSEKDFKNK